MALCEELDIELKQVPDWNCCGATAAHNLNKELSLSLPARILAMAEKAGMTEILVPCAACYSRLTVTQHELNTDASLKEKVVDIIGMPYSGSVKILNVIQMLQKYAVDKLSDKIKKPFEHNVACYYGCLLVRPHEVLQFDRAEDPQTMDVLMTQIGAKPLDWAFKTECCGAGFSVSQPSIVGRLSGKILKDATDRGAEAMIVACPMCHSNLDMRRPAIENYLQASSKVPVLFITQAIGLALGISPKRLGLQRHFVPVQITNE
jgi:heterodisulfide reductase subunit B